MFLVRSRTSRDWWEPSKDLATKMALDGYSSFRIQVGGEIKNFKGLLGAIKRSCHHGVPRWLLFIQSPCWWWDERIKAIILIVCGLLLILLPNTCCLLSSHSLRALWTCFTYILTNDSKKILHSAHNSIIQYVLSKPSLAAPTCPSCFLCGVINPFLHREKAKPSSFIKIFLFFYFIFQ